MPSTRIGDLRAKARHAQEIADRFAHDKQTVENLRSYAADLEREAARLEQELAAVKAAELPDGQQPQNGPDAIAALRIPSPKDGE